MSKAEAKRPRELTEKEKEQKDLRKKVCW